MKAFGLLSDLHFHSWASFSEDDEDGVNKRLSAMLGELKRCAAETKAAGGNRIYCGGDVFHTRNNISPLVLNPVIDAFTELTEKGFEFRIISGNHDLARRDSERLSSAVTALEMPGVEVVNESKLFSDDKMLMIPWFDKLGALQEEIQTAMNAMNENGENHTDYTLIIHAPVNGVIKGIPDSGLDPDWLAKLGFKRVFSGHYHHHQQFPGEVYSIGALCHQTWSDVGSKAGFLVVDDIKTKYFKSHLPEFLDLDQLSEFDPDEIPLLVDGNYVRIKTDKSSSTDIEKIRTELQEWGAKGILIRSIPEARVTREGGLAVSVKSGASISKSVSDYVTAQSFANKDKVSSECRRILTQAEVEA